MPEHATGSAASVDPDFADWFDEPQRPLVLAIARPVRKKNLAGLLRAYAGCPLLREKANLVILTGQRDGPSDQEEREVFSELTALVRQNELGRQVALPLRHTAGDVAALYARAARSGVFVNPALHEPFGLTLIEAAAAGVPVVATRRGGPREIVGNLGHGLLVDPLDDGAIAAACLRIVTDQDLHRRFAAAGRHHAALYSWSNYAARSVECYRSVQGPRLIVCDIDGTLTGCREGAAAFRHWRRRSRLRFAIATGRSFPEALDVLREWGMPEPDALIVDVGTRIVLRGDTGDWENWRPFSNGISLGWSRDAVEQTAAEMGLAAQAPATLGPHKCSYFGTLAEADAIRERLTQDGLQARVVFSHGNLIDIIPQAAGKAAAIEAYAASVGLSLGQCLAAGDSGNDRDMLERCGRAIIVSNALPELDAIAPRPGLFRATRPHASGVMEGLAAFGLTKEFRQP